MKLPYDKHFGEGWMSKNAADLCKIVFVFGGVDKIEMIFLLNKIHPGGETINEATICKALQIMENDQINAGWLNLFGKLYA